MKKLKRFLNYRAPYVILLVISIIVLLGTLIVRAIPQVFPGGGMSMPGSMDFSGFQSGSFDPSSSTQGGSFDPSSFTQGGNSSNFGGGFDPSALGQESGAESGSASSEEKGSNGSGNFGGGFDPSTLGQGNGNFGGGFDPSTLGQENGAESGSASSEENGNSGSSFGGGMVMPGGFGTETATKQSGFTGFLQGVRKAWIPISIVSFVLMVFCIVRLAMISNRRKRAREEAEAERMKNLTGDEILVLRAKEEAERLSALKGQKKTKNIILAGVLVVVLVFVTVASRMLTSGTSITANSSVNEELISASAEKSDITTTIKGAGTVASDDSTDVTLPGTVTVAKWLVSNGDTVEAGDAIAEIDTDSVAAVIADLQKLISELDADLETSRSDTISEEISAVAGGRVIAIYAEADRSVAEVMSGSGALMILSLDGTLAVRLEQNSAVTVGSSVTVTSADGTEYEGKVVEKDQTSMVVTVSDEETTVGDSVSVTDADGNALGSGTLYVHSEQKVTGFTGTISEVNVEVGDAVEAEDVLITLEDAAYSMIYDELLEKRSTLEEQMRELILAYASGYVYADETGVISGIDETETTASAGAENGTKISASEGLSDALTASLESLSGVLVSASDIIDAVKTAVTSADSLTASTVGSGVAGVLTAAIGGTVRIASLVSGKTLLSEADDPASESAAAAENPENDPTEENAQDTDSTEEGTGNSTETAESTTEAPGETDPTGGNTDPTSGSTNPTSANTDPTGGNTDPTSGSTDPTGGNTDPTSGSTDPTSGNTDPTGENTDPTGGAPSGDPSGNAPTGDPSGNAPTGDPSGNAPTGDPSGNAPTGDPSGNAPTGDPSGNTPSGDPSGNGSRIDTDTLREMLISKINTLDYDTLMQIYDLLKNAEGGNSGSTDPSVPSGGNTDSGNGSGFPGGGENGSDPSNGSGFPGGNGDSDSDSGNGSGFPGGNGQGGSGSFDIGNMGNPGGGSFDMGSISGGAASSDDEEDEEDDIDVTKYVLSSSTFCSITPDSEIHIDISVDEQDIFFAQEGKKVTVALDALTGRSFEGTITHIENTGENNGGNTKFTVTVTMTPEENILVGMNASVLIAREEKTDVLTIPLNAVYEEGSKMIVYTSYDEKTDTLGDPVEIEVGVSDDNNVEILSGLSEGDVYYYRYAGSITYNFLNRLTQ